MAETWTKAYGRYLKVLRLRKGLSLKVVEALSQAFVERLDKAYLSRCENGYQGPAFSKIIPISRIYEVPADVLLERLELDMELDRIGGPETEGLSFLEAAEASLTAINQGYVWKGYALRRDALVRARVDDPAPRYQNLEEQEGCAIIFCASAAMRLGRRRYALHELQHVEKAHILSPRHYPVLLERLSACHRLMGDIVASKQYGDRAIAQAERCDWPDRLGYAYASRALVANFERDDLLAAELHQKAYKAFREAGKDAECARTLVNLSQAYLNLGRPGAARRTLEVVEKTAVREEQHRIVALSRILMGEIDIMEHRGELATHRWQEAATIARRLDDKVLRFQAEFHLFKQARETGNAPVERSLCRRLRRLANWVPGDMEELLDFRRVLATMPPAKAN